MPSEYDVNAPPKTIWDPQPPSLTSTRSRSSSPSHNSRLSDDDDDKDPIQWNNQAMRIQLWDTFRLARIILGEPVKTPRLTSHLILHAIRKVAEMKLQIAMLQKEMNDQFFEARAKAETAAAMSNATSAPPATLLSTLETVPEASEADMSPRLVTPSSGNDGRAHHFYYESASDDEDVYLEDMFDETSQDLELYGRASTGIKSKPSLDTTNTPTTWDSSLDSLGAAASQDHVGVLRREILSQPSLQHPSSPHRTLSPQPSDEYTKLLRQQSQKHHWEIEAMLQNLDSKVQETSDLTSSQILALHSKLAEAQNRQAAVMQQQEQRLKRSGLRPSPTEERAARIAKQQARRHQQEMEAMLQELHEKVQETSEHTSEQIQSLFELLQHAKMQQETVHVQALGNLHRQMKDQEQAQKEHLDVIVLKYLQTQEKLEEKLTKTQESLHDQLHLAEDWQRKCQQLGGSNVSTAEAQAVLKKVQALSELLHAPPVRKGRIKKITLTRSEIERVNQDVIQLLSRMVTAKPTTSPPVTVQKAPMEVPEDLKRAMEKQAATLEELDFMKLQKEMLLDDTSKVTPEDLKGMTAAATEQFKKELEHILEAEGHRMQEIDSLESELNHLAYLAVQIETCERDFREQQQMYQQSLEELRAQNESSTTKLRTLQKDVQQTVEEQVIKRVGDSSNSDSSLSAADLRILELEDALAKHDAELESTQAQLNISQERVRRLEAAIASQ